MVLDTTYFFAASIVRAKGSSAVDIYAAMMATWNADAPAFFARHPNMKALHDLVAARPRIAKVWARNEV
jgi:glutathione S-transferase